jgi:hypothetical protein
MTDSDFKRYQRAFADELGYAPNNLPLYRWFRTRDLSYLIDNGVEDRTPSGLIVRVDGRYKKVTWEERLGREWPWIVGTWQDPGTPSEWYAKYRDLIPYPSMGMYFPIDGSQIPCDPTLEITMEAVAKIKQVLGTSYETALSQLIESADKADAKLKSASDDQIDSDWPAFNCEPVVPGYTPEKAEICQTE